MKSASNREVMTSPPNFTDNVLQQQVKSSYTASHLQSSHSNSSLAKRLGHSASVPTNADLHKHHKNTEVGMSLEPANVSVLNGSIDANVLATKRGAHEAPANLLVDTCSLEYERKLLQQQRGNIHEVLQHLQLHLEEVQRGYNFAENKHEQLKTRLCSLLRKATLLQQDCIKPDSRVDLESDILEVGINCEDRRESLRHVRGLRDALSDQLKSDDMKLTKVRSRMADLRNQIHADKQSLVDEQARKHHHFQDLCRAEIDYADVEARTLKLQCLFDFNQLVTANEPPIFNDTSGTGFADVHEALSPGRAATKRVQIEAQDELADCR